MCYKQTSHVIVVTDLQSKHLFSAKYSSRTNLFSNNTL